jgi:hypothetical protein
MAELNRWDDNLRFSQGDRAMQDVDTIRSLIPNCIDVTIVEDSSSQAAGIDYIAHLKDGATLNVDAKGRTKGAAKYWKDGEPELAVEVWSVMPQDGQPGKVGWTFDTSKQTDLVLFYFDDTEVCYLIGFQHLRMAAIANYDAWKTAYMQKPQLSERDGVRWNSQAMFVPARVVLDAIRSASRAVRS